MVWLKTMRGGWMPADPTNVLELDQYFDRTRHTAHFATCPKADQFRKRAKK